MTDRPITGEDAGTYLNHVHKHGLSIDTDWLIEAGRFPVGCQVLDIGCGTGTFIAALSSDKQFYRSVIGVELSPELAKYASQLVGNKDATVYEADILTWSSPDEWNPDTVVMSFFLHHSNNNLQHLNRVASLLPHGGRLYVFDRIALDQSSLDEFSVYWKEYYCNEHEWHEELPNLNTTQGLIDLAGNAGFDFVRRQVCPHDHRKGAERFPKTLMEFWRHKPKKHFPAIMLVSPAHQENIDEICDELSRNGLIVEQQLKVSYSDKLIRRIYERCPWREQLLNFVSETCSQRIATALFISGDITNPNTLQQLSMFKKTHRDRWHSIKGPIESNGFQAMILPFHVSEPYESELMVHLLELS